MSNRIDPMHHGIVNKSGNKVSESGSGAKMQPAGSADPGISTEKTTLRDTVALSDRSQLLERLEKNAAHSPAFDQARVDAIKQDIASGNYRIDVDNIADILLRSEQDPGDSS